MKSEWITDRWLEVAEGLNVQDGKPKPIVMGRHLLEIMPPGPAMGCLLQELFQAQLDGEFLTLEEGLERVENICQCDINLAII
jgi:hypothetical protein